MSDVAPKLDKTLWFLHAGCVGRHYVLGNAHTVPGRLLAWCPVEKTSLFVSRGDMGRISGATRYWLDGFLCGSVPAPPAGEDGPPDFSSRKYKNWEEAATRFRQSGYWREGRK